MRALVTGAAGFVGAAVTRALLQKGVSVVAAVRPSGQHERLRGLAVTRLDLDLMDAGVNKALAGLAIDACVHSAWYAEPGKYQDSPSNIDHVEASVALVRALIDSGCKRFVGVGTCAEYEMTSAPLREDARTLPTRLYSASKLAFWLMAEQLCAQKNVAAAWARIFNPYGPDEARGRLLDSVLSALHRDQPALTSAGEQVRDYLHVDDIGGAIAAIAMNPVAGVVNVGSGGGDPG